jgi:hypothetical protein
MRNIQFWLKATLIIILVTFIGSYSVFQARKIMSGPKISIASPHNGATVQDSLIYVAGVAKNIKEISVNDRPIFIDENGNFQEKLLLSPGYNIIKLKAKDKFGKEVQKEIQNVLIQN